jgi:hypothetical protein
MLADWLALLLPVLIGVGLIGIAALVAKTGWEHRHNRFFSGLYLLSGIKSASEGLLAQTTDAQGQAVFFAERFHTAAPLFPGAAQWFYANAVCTAFMIPLLLLFVLNFPRPAAWVLRHPKGQLALLLPSPLLAVTLIYTGLTQGPDTQVLVSTVFNNVATALTIAALALLVRTRKAAHAIERKQAGYILLGFLPGFLVTWVITALADAGFLLGGGQNAVLQALVDQVQSDVLRYVSPILEFAAAALVAFAILKYRILSFELQVKGGMKYIVMSVIVGTVLFLLNTYVGNFILQGQVFSFAGPSGSAVLSGIFTILMFKPVEKLSAKATDRLFPDTARDPKAYARRRAQEIYQAQTTHVLRDGHMSDREWAFLHALRDQLGLPEGEARAIEEQVERELGVDDARLGRRRVGTSATPATPQAGEGAVEVHRASPLDGAGMGETPAGPSSDRPRDRPESLK